MEEQIVLKSGRVLTPNNGILGLEWRADDTIRGGKGRWYMTEGYDNLSDEDSSWTTSVPQLTQAERDEIAVMMVGRWLAWADKR